MPEFVTLPTGDSIPAAWLNDNGQATGGAAPRAAEAILCFFGSRTLQGKKLMALIKGEILARKAVMIVTAGEPDGVCQAAQKAAKDTSIPLKLHFLDRKRNARGAFYHRSMACLKECTHAIFIHDGKSQGTRNELGFAAKMHKPHSYYVVTPTGDFKYVEQGGRLQIDHPEATR